MTTYKLPYTYKIYVKAPDYTKRNKKTNSYDLIDFIDVEIEDIDESETKTFLSAKVNLVSYKEYSYRKENICLYSITPDHEKEDLTIEYKQTEDSFLKKLHIVDNNKSKNIKTINKYNLLQDIENNEDLYNMFKNIFVHREANKDIKEIDPNDIISIEKDENIKNAIKEYTNKYVSINGEIWKKVKKPYITIYKINFEFRPILTNETDNHIYSGDSLFSVSKINQALDSIKILEDERNISKKFEYSYDNSISIYQEDEFKNIFEIYLFLSNISNFMKETERYITSYEKDIIESWIKMREDVKKISFIPLESFKNNEEEEKISYRFKNSDLIKKYNLKNERFIGEEIGYETIKSINKSNLYDLEEKINSSIDSVEEFLNKSKNTKLKDINRNLFFNIENSVKRLKEQDISFSFNL